MTTTTTAPIADADLTREAAKRTRLHARVGVTLDNFGEDDPKVVFAWTGSAHDKALDLIRWQAHAPVTFRAAVQELQRRGKLDRVMKQVRLIAAGEA